MEPWGWESNLNMKLIYVSYVLFTYNQKVILYSIFLKNVLFI